MAPAKAPEPAKAVAPAPATAVETHSSTLAQEAAAVVGARAADQQAKVEAAKQRRAAVAVRFTLPPGRCSLLPQPSQP